MYTGTNLEFVPTWSAVVGNGIGGAQPAGYGFNVLPDCVQFYTVGGQYDDWLAKLVTPLCPNTGHLQFSFDINPDESTQYYAQALEFDNRITDANGWNYNLSSQLNYAEGGHLQVANASGAWVDTGLYPGILPADTWTTFRYVYTFDTTNRVCSFVTASVGSQSSAIAVQNIPAAQLNWTPNSCVTQVQLDTSAAAGTGNHGFSHKMRNITLIWS